GRGWLAQHALRDYPDPRPGGVDQHPGAGDIAPPALLQYELPDLAALGAHAAGAGADHGAALGRVEGIEHHQARIVGLAIVIFEAHPVTVLEWRAQRIATKVDGAARGQDFAAAEMVIDEQPDPQHPGRTHPRLL